MSSSASVSPTNQGLGLIELIISMGIFAIIAYGVVAVIVGNLGSNSQSRDHLRAVLLAREGLEAVRNLRDQDWANMVDGQHYLSMASGWQLSSTPETIGKYSRILDISSTTATTKKVICTVDWLAAPSRPLSVSLTTYLTNWRTPPTPAASCSGLCLSAGFTSGLCRANPNQCTPAGVYYPGGDVYCQTPSDNTCCCYPAEPISTATPTPANTPTPTPTTIPVTCHTYCQSSFSLTGTCVKPKDCGGQNRGKIYECSGSTICCCQ